MNRRYGSVSPLHVVLVALIIVYVAGLSVAAVRSTTSVDAGELLERVEQRHVQSVSLADHGGDVELLRTFDANRSAIPDRGRTVLRRVGLG